MPLNNKEEGATAVQEKEFQLLTPGNLVQVCATLKETINQASLLVVLLLTVYDFFSKP